MNEEIQMSTVKSKSRFITQFKTSHFALLPIQTKIFNFTQQIFGLVLIQCATNILLLN